MKKFSILLVSALALGLTFTSCTNDDDNTMGSVEGKWNFNKVSYTTSGITTPEQDFDDNEPGCNKDYIELLTGGVAKAGDYYDASCSLDVSTGVWTRSGNTITIVDSGDVETLEIVSVSATALKLKSTYTEGTTSVTVNVSFTKA